MNVLLPLDYLIFFVYFLMVAGYGFWVYRQKKSKVSGSQDYFLAEGSLTWWAIGASLIASNISAEQFIGTSGSGFKMGLAIASYEWMAGITLLIVASVFIPVYLKNKIYTMPQFLNMRYNSTVSTIMAVFWLLLYVTVNLTSIVYLGALAVSAISGLNLYFCLGGLAIFAIFITLGGMKVIGYTDVLQVFFLILGGLVTTYIALNLVAHQFGSTGFLNGFALMKQHAEDHFHMILKRDNPSFADLPGLTVLIGGMWIANLNYWGCNQYITQRALGADLKTARGGLLFAACLKILMPVIVVLPGIAAYVLYKEGNFHQEMLQNGELNPDKAYPVLLNLLPTGFKGLSFAALTAAVVASLAGKANSISTIFTLDIYRKIFNKTASEARLVRVGKITVVVAMVIAVALCTQIGIEKKGGFQFIQEYTGYVSPGIFAMFILGFFWKKTTSDAALFATIGGFLISIIYNLVLKYTSIDFSFLASSGFAVKNEVGRYIIPFLDRMGFVFIFCVIGMWIISTIQNNQGVKPKGLIIDTAMFKLDKGFLVGGLLVIGVIAALYSVYW